MYSDKDLGFILYNNRSVDGVVKNFLPDVNIRELILIETRLKILKKRFEKDKTVGIDKSELILEAEDINVYPSEISQLSHDFHTIKMYGDEKQWLLDRGITEEIMEEYKLTPLSRITNKKSLEVIGATTHPLLKDLFDDGIEGGGIIIPLFKGNELINCTIRKISDIGKLKYSQACPDVHVWGLDDINEGDEVWITEGLFDMMAVRSLGTKCVSVSSAMWSSVQLVQLLEKKPGSVVIFCDNDRTGLRCGAILKELMNQYYIPSITVISDYKDASELIFQNYGTLDDVKNVDVTLRMIEQSDIQDFNFTRYLKNRKF